MKTERRRGMVSVLFILWGIIWIIYGSGGIFGDILGGFFVIIGTLFFLHSLRELLLYKKTGEIKTRIDERAELNSLRASRKGFEFLLVAIGVLLASLGFKFINETVFTALMGPVFALGAMIYILSYYKYERRDIE